jgi:hypothetical protein
MPTKKVTATGPDGQKLELKNGQWVPLATTELQQAQQSLSGTGNDRKGGAQFIKSAIGTTLANVLGLPHAAGELLALGGAIPETVGGSVAAMAKGQPMNVMDRFANARMKQEESLPASALLAMPEPTAEDVLAVPGTIQRAPSAIAAHYWDGSVAPYPGGLPSEDVAKAFEASRDEQVAAAAERPMDSAAGRTVGDVATMLGLRPGNWARKLLSGPRSAPTAAPETLSALNKAARSIGAGLGKTAESGFEGALMGALGDGDPAKTAAYAAGIQAAGSAALEAKGWVFKRGLRTTIVDLWIGHEIWKAVMPGPQNALESKDQVINEVVGAFGVGALAAIAGAGRPPGPLASAFSSASRGVISSVITQLQEAAGKGQEQYAKVVEQMAKDPDYFGQEVRTRIERAARSEKPQQLMREIDRLMDSTRFRQKYNAIE